MGLGASHCKGVWAPREVSLTTLSTAAVFLIFTVPGNLLIILSVLLDPNKNLRRTPYILLILNLAITDLIVGAMVEPLSMYTHWNEAHGLSISNSWLSQFVYFTCCTASLLSLCILTFDRYLAITSPMWYRANMTNTRVQQASILIWVLSFSSSGLLFVTGFVTYAFIFATLTLLCAIFILAFTYVRIFLVVKRKVIELNNLHQGDAERKKAQERNMLWERKLTKTHLVMLLAFLACYAPACIMIYLMNVCSSCSCEVIHWLRDMHFVLITLNSLINPFVYALRLSGIREAISYFLRPCLRCRSGAVAPEHSQEPSQRVENNTTPSAGLQVSRPLVPELLPVG
ncbi:hypothetical protein OS493_033504 [Desmophyllum pertusum]|uniref:G-protein coupled receptors family 1 profile domain-containing protein n=1 Tax=Desmophyllum pertusum TaxID=174260 RepID=A0A9W9Z814_9CNID|nr:hypothetical protein OS493_033504 [Desmophyllum pertusum]